MKTKNIAVGALVAVLTLALWWNFLLKPTRSEASKVKADTDIERAKLQPLQAQLDQANADAAHADTFKAQLAALQRRCRIRRRLRRGSATRTRSPRAPMSRGSRSPTEHRRSVRPGFGRSRSGSRFQGTYAQVVEYITQLATLSRLVVVDGVTLTTSANTGAGACAAVETGASTGPFSGGSVLARTISARMFETPPMVADPVTGLQSPVVSTARRRQLDRWVDGRRRLARPERRARCRTADRPKTADCGVDRGLTR